MISQPSWILQNIDSNVTNRTPDNPVTCISLSTSMKQITDAAVLAGELQKFNAYPTFNSYEDGKPRTQIINCIRINNTSETITADNGYSLAWQILNTKRTLYWQFRNPNLDPTRHNGNDKRNFWCTITGGVPRNCCLPPIVDSINSGLYTDIINNQFLKIFHTVKNKLKNINMLSISGLGRPYNFVIQRKSLIQIDTTIPVRLSLIASRKKIINPGHFPILTDLINISTVKVCWEGKISISANTGNGLPPRGTSGIVTISTQS